MPVVWERVQEDIQLLEPGFYADVHRFLDESPYTWYVLEAYRSRARSAELYRAYKFEGGPRAAPPGQSAHNWGLAIDVVPDTDAGRQGLQPSWKITRPEWQWLKIASIPHPRLTVGWRFGDWPHIQRYRWKRYKHWSDNPTIDPTAFGLGGNDV